MEPPRQIRREGRGGGCEIRQRTFPLWKAHGLMEGTGDTPLDLPTTLNSHFDFRTGLPGLTGGRRGFAYNRGGRLWVRETPIWHSCTGAGAGGRGQPGWPAALSSERSGPSRRLHLGASTSSGAHALTSDVSHRGGEALSALRSWPFTEKPASPGWHGGGHRKPLRWRMPLRIEGIGSFPREVQTCPHQSLPTAPARSWLRTSHVPKPVWLSE